MLTGKGVPGRWRQVNHDSPSGDLPIRYLAVPAGDDGGVVAIGRDLRAVAATQQRLLRAQQAMERDSLRLRQLEARYRLLFDSAPEAIIVVDATSRRMIEANPAARRLAGLGTGALDGTAFTAVIHNEDRDAAIALVGAAAAAKQQHPSRLRLADGQPARVSATLFRQDRGNSLLIRLVPLETGEATGNDRPLDEVLDRMPDAFVLTDSDMAILAGNGAFLDLVQQPRASDVRGQPLSRFVGRPGIDVALLESQLREHGSIRGFATVLRGSGGVETEVEISAVTSNDSGSVRHGFSLRVMERPRAAAVDDRQTPRSVEQLTELVGRVSLKEIVRESTDLIERLCIEAALSYTSDNRASAAEILGLSRQSLYSKLHRHGLGNLSEPD
jgi:transcriptional regulator PpsR